MTTGRTAPAGTAHRTRRRSSGLRRSTRLFGRLLALNIAMTFRYRGEFVIMQATTLLVPVISLLVWQAALAAGAELPVDAGYLTAYFVLVSLVSMLTASWTAFYLAESIRLGTLTRWLIRPASTHLDAAANNLGEKIVKLVLLVPLVGVVALVFRRRFALPTDGVAWLLFAVAVLAGAALLLGLDILLGSLAFWFDDVQGFLRAYALIQPVLSGAVVPLALVPPAFADVVALQPFRFVVSFPMEILLGGAVAGQSLGTGFAAQAGWLVIVLGSAALVWRRGLRSYSAAGV